MISHHDEGTGMNIQEKIEEITEWIEGSDESSNEVFGAAIRELVAAGTSEETIGKIAVGVQALIDHVNGWRDENGLPLV
jgi:hypothetical protein